MRVSFGGVAALLAGLFFTGQNAAAFAGCLPAGGTVGVDELAARVEREGRRYVFVGERHAVGPVKRFAVDLAHELSARGHDVGLYVEGFRTDCPPLDARCRDLARLFNADAFGRLLDEAAVPVHAIDPPESDRRAARMAAAVAGGGEAIRIVLAGKTHVAHAGDPGAEILVYGGGMRYPDPGDLVEAFPAEESLTVVLETRVSGRGSYSLRAGGCGSDYTLLTPDTTAY